MTGNVPQDELLPCPFCGGRAEYGRMGSLKKSCVIVCSECGCTLETGEIWMCGQRWNTRVMAPPSGRASD